MTVPLAIENGGYVGGAYLVFLLLLLIYVAIMAAKLQRIQREINALAELADSAGPGGGPNRDLGRIHEREHEIEGVREGARR